MKLFDGIKLYGALLPQSEFKFFSDTGELTRENTTDEDIRLLFEKAEEYLEAPIPQLIASEYMRFYYDGNRNVYEAKQFRRRYMLRVLTLAEKLEGKGKFTKKIIDILWLICEETTWVLPAHNYRCEDDYVKTPLTPDYEGETTIIDLFSAETGADLAMVYYLVSDAIAKVSVEAVKRLEYILDERILKPFEKYLYGWEGYTKTAFINNWDPWIISNVLCVIAAMEKNYRRREALTEKALFILDRFVATYHLDGGCDEGPSYWTAAGASLFDCLEILYDMTGGKSDYFTGELVYNMCDFFRRMYIDGNYIVNFADAPSTIDVSTLGRLLYRMGRKTNNKELAAFASYVEGGKSVPASVEGSMGYRRIKSFFEPTPVSNNKVSPPLVTYFKGITVAVLRDKAEFSKGLFFAMKGGTNGESHNHNDIGSFVVYKDGKPLLIDIGVGTYTANTFNENRYKIFSMCSPYHNIPSFISDKGEIAQLPSIDYHGKVISFNGEEKELKLELNGAYPEGSGISSYVRSGKLYNGAVRIRDEIKTDAKLGKIFNFVTLEKPELKDGIIMLGNGEMTIPDGGVVSFEEIVFEDVRFVNNWKRDRFYRIRIEFSAAEGCTEFEIR